MAGVGRWGGALCVCGGGGEKLRVHDVRESIIIAIVTRGKRDNSSRYPEEIIAVKKRLSNNYWCYYA